MLCSSVTLLLTVLGALLVLGGLAGKTCERLFYLTCYVLFAYLLRLIALSFLLVLLTIALLLRLVSARFACGGTCVLAVFATLLVVGGIVYIHALLAYTCALLALS